MYPNEVILLVALPAEAKPLIRAFGLQRRQPDGAFPRYVNGPLTLVLTGPGEQAAGKATTYALTSVASEPSLWVNLGIAGHGTLAQGECLLAECIREISSGQEWCLQAPAVAPDFALSPLHCVPEPETGYAEAVGYDMESAAIARALSQRDLLSRLQVVKVVSDNPTLPAQGIGARMVGELIQAQLPTIKNLINRLRPNAQPQ
jgi:hypothetical protein